MQFKDLIPWGRGRKELTSSNNENPVMTLQRDIGRVFDDFWNRWNQPFGTGSVFSGLPSVDMTETDKAVEVSVELPGMDEKDIELNVSDGMLILRGQKSSERKEEKKDYYLSERSFGSFHRAIPLPPGVDTNTADANFKKGVLTVSFPKTAKAQETVRKIPVKG